MTNQWTLRISKVGPTDEQMAKVCEEAEKGSSLSSCAANADLSKYTLEHWWRQGKPALTKAINGETLTQTEAIYARFAERFAKARAKGIKANEDEMVRKIDADSGAWTGRAWRLERGHRDEFGKAPEIVQGGQPIVIHIEGRPSRELEPEAFIDGEATLVGSDDQSSLPSAPPAASVP